MHYLQQLTDGEQVLVTQTSGAKMLCALLSDQTLCSLKVRTDTPLIFRIFSKLSHPGAIVLLALGCSVDTAPDLHYSHTAQNCNLNMI